MKHIVGVSDMKLSSDSNDTIVTYALGSCIGVSIYDPVAKVGGILHYMLPLSKLDKDKAEENPFMFGDIGIPRLFKEAYELGAVKKRLRIVIAGGASVLGIQNRFQTGKKNITIARKLFWKNGLLINAEHTGDDLTRTLYLDLSTGRTWFTNDGVDYEL
jgi:chemotaxis protein CheD